MVHHPLESNHAGTSQDAATAVERMRLTFDLYATGEALMRQRICRENPGLSPSEVEVRLAAWLQTRPGAEHGDAEGQPGTWPRTRKS